MIFDRPVLIVGAPRSGSSLLQKLVREHPAFVSVPRESDMIWFRHTHPERNAWDGEGVPPSRLSDDVCAEIRSDFARLAVSAAAWRRWSSLGLMENPATAAIVRALYPLAKPIFRIAHSARPRPDRPVRLVDKSVHMGLWLDLALKTFPDAIVLHIVRDPATCIPSMIGGWREPGRFETFDVPAPLDIGGCTATKWKFPLPPGWRDCVKAPVGDVAAFQWAAIQSAILAHEAALGERYMRVRLEDLSAFPGREIQGLCAHIGIAFDAHFQRAAADLPVVNAAERKRAGTGAAAQPDLRLRVARIAERLGYAESPT